MNDDEFWEKFIELVASYKYKGDERREDIEAHKIFSELKKLVSDKLDEMKERGYDLAIGDRDY